MSNTMLHYFVCAICRWCYLVRQTVCNLCIRSSFYFGNLNVRPKDHHSVTCYPTQCIVYKLHQPFKHFSRYIIAWWKGLDPIKRFLSATFVCLSNTRIWFPRGICRGLFYMYAHWVEVRDNCSFCWHWLNGWQSRFKLSFHNKLEQLFITNTIVWRHHNNGLYKEITVHILKINLILH